jgi:hypothetical protein
MLSSSSTNIEFSVQPHGIPSGLSDLYTTGITLTPTLISSSPSVGSPAGSILTATVKGVGIATPLVTLTNAAGTDVCSSVKITAYSIV